MDIWFLSAISASDVYGYNNQKSKIIKLLQIIQYVGQNNDDMNVFLWSDGPASQFKSRFMHQYISDLQVKYNLSSLSWNGCVVLLPPTANHLLTVWEVLFGIVLRQELISWEMRKNFMRSHRSTVLVLICYMWVVVWSKVHAPGRHAVPMASERWHCVLLRQWHFV